MVHMRRARGPHLHHLHPFVLGKMRARNLVRIFHFAPRRNLHRLRHLHHEIRLRDVPPFPPCPRRRRIPRIPRGRSSVCPRRNRRNLLLTQRRIVRKMSVSRIGKPWRHHLHLHRIRHLPRPRPRLAVSHQRHRRCFPAPMTTLTFVSKYRNHVLIERRRRRFFATPGRNARHLPGRSHHQE